MSTVIDSYTQGQYVAMARWVRSHSPLGLDTTIVAQNLMRLAEDTRSELFPGYRMTIESVLEMEEEELPLIAARTPNKALQALAYWRMENPYPKRG